MSETGRRPSDALTKPRRPLLIGAVVAGVVLALSGVGVGAYAIGQAVAPATFEEAPAADPTPTEEPNVEPTASFSVLTVDGLAISVDGANSIDPDGEIASYEWEFGDGATASGATAGHSYGAYGTYTVTLTVTDADGASGAFSAEVTLIAPPPPPPPPPPAAPVFGQYPSGYPVPNIPGTDQPDTTACASSAAYTGSDGRAYCA